MAEKKRLPVRQGDVLLVPIEMDDLPYRDRKYNFTPVERKRGEGIIVAAGEATGHHHRIRSRHARMLRTHGGRTLVRVNRTSEKVLLTHEEHKPIALAPGLYEYVPQREYEPQASTRTRRVYD